MHILFDYQAFEMQQFGGVSRSYAEIIAHLEKKEDFDYQVGIKESDNVHLIECNLTPKLKPFHFSYNKWLGGRKWFKGQRTITRVLLKIIGQANEYKDINQKHCIHLLKRQQFDIFEPTFFDPYFLPHLKGKPFVLTVHDMIPELLNADHIQVEQKKVLCPLATHIHVPSQNTKDDLVRILNIPSEKIAVIPHGAPINPPERKPLFEFPYLLFVGGRWSYKNFVPFINECTHIIEHYPDLYVVCTGDYFSKEEMNLFSELKISEHIVNVPRATEELLQALYQHAEAFVYPSSYEGFGMPILEAFINGCPAFLNNASCFPEVGGDAAVYFDINRRGDLAEHIEAFLQAPEQDKADMIARGRERSKLFSWEESAKKLKQVYENIL